MDEKKIGRPKEMDNAKPITFKLPETLYLDLKDYASSCGQRVTDVLREFVEDLVATHKQKIAAFRRQKDKRVKAFATPSKPETPTKKSARATTKKSAAQMADAAPEMVTSDGSDGDAVKVGEGNAENS